MVSPQSIALMLLGIAAGANGALPFTLPFPMNQGQEALDQPHEQMLGAFASFEAQVSGAAAYEPGRAEFNRKVRT